MTAIQRIRQLEDQFHTERNAHLVTKHELAAAMGMRDQARDRLKRKGDELAVIRAMVTGLWRGDIGQKEARALLIEVKALLGGLTVDGT